MSGLPFQHSRFISLGAQFDKERIIAMFSSLNSYWFMVPEAPDGGYFLFIHVRGIAGSHRDIRPIEFNH
ncbi:hypothetical protein Cob_v010979 [Colletotrichum orbiculare MAFF 240422]|uniref:Uncharacterized protein n=1 Tax=Colletotrichum orbiculare (strain 104-T / ATCC 96160 / CBS 514.97 / LARS 414 / MAFF 240422) TaxID=1213857 RepID=A0A484FDA0_COLOR|nr:hypothetical protein Cob_v010979 [Colletotrichum orbiculare MAFF 240422]